MSLTIAGVEKSVMLGGIPSHQGGGVSALPAGYWTGRYLTSWCETPNKCDQHCFPKTSDLYCIEKSQIWNHMILSAARHRAEFQNGMKSAAEKSSINLLYDRHGLYLRIPRRDGPQCPSAMQGPPGLGYAVQMTGSGQVEVTAEAVPYRISIRLQ